MPARATGCGSDAGTGTGRGTSTERGTVLCPIAGRHYGPHAGMDDGRNGCLADCRPRGRRHKSTFRRTVTLGTPILRPADYTDSHPGRSWTVEFPGRPLSTSTSFSSSFSSTTSTFPSSSSTFFSTSSSPTFSSSFEPGPPHQQLLQTDSIRFGSKDADCHPDSATDIRLVLRGSLLARIGQPPPPHTTGHLPGPRLLGSPLPLLPQCADRPRSHVCATPLRRRTFSSRRRSQNHSTHAAFRLRHQTGSVLHADDRQEGVRCEPTDYRCVWCEPAFVRCEPTDNGCVKCEPAFVQCEPTLIRTKFSDNRDVRSESSDNRLVQCEQELHKLCNEYVQCDGCKCKTVGESVRCEPTFLRSKPTLVRCEPTHKLCFKSFRCESTLVRCESTFVWHEPPTHKLCLTLVQCEPAFLRRPQTPEDSSKTLVSSRPSVDRLFGPGILAHSPHHTATTKRPVSIAHASVKTRCKPVEILVKCSSRWGLSLATVTTNVPQGLSLFMLRRVEILFISHLISATIFWVIPTYLC